MNKGHRYHEQEYEEEEKLPYKKVKDNRYGQEEDNEYGDDDKDLEQMLENEEYNEEDLLQAIEEAEHDQNLAFDHDNLVKLINQFDKHILKNGQLRSQFSNHPQKFMESEVELDDDIKKFYHITAYPELIALFLNSNAIKNMIQLLSHENIDIRIEVIGFLKDLFQLEFEKEEEEKYWEDVLQVMQKFVDCTLLEGLYQNLEKANEKKQEEYDCVFKILEIIETVMDAKQQFLHAIGQKQELVKWILNRMLDTKIRILDDNRYYCSEILSSMLSIQENQAVFCKLGGIEKTINALSAFKSKDPEAEEEREHAHNMFNILNILLLEPQNQEEFKTKFGLELMIKMIKQKGYCAQPSLKVIQLAIYKNQEACKSLIECEGLKYIAPIMIMKGVKSKKEEEQRQINEQVFAILKSLIQETKGIVLERIVNKFRESDFQKTDRLFELHNYYFGTVTEMGRRMSHPQYIARLQESSKEPLTQEEIQESIYFKKQDYGLFALESIDFLILYLSQWKDGDIQNKVAKCLQMHDSVKKEAIDILKENIKMHNTKNTEKDIEEIKKLINGLEN